MSKQVLFTLSQALKIGGYPEPLPTFLGKQVCVGLFRFAQKTSKKNRLPGREAGQQFLDILCRLMCAKAKRAHLLEQPSRFECVNRSSGGLFVQIQHCNRLMPF